MNIRNNKFKDIKIGGYILEKYDNDNSFVAEKISKSKIKIIKSTFVSNLNFFGVGVIKNINWNEYVTLFNPINEISNQNIELT